MKLAGTAASAPARVALSAPAGKTLTKAGESLGSPARKAERMAMLDARLLDDRTLGDIGRRAAAELLILGNDQRGEMGHCRSGRN